MSAAVRSAGQHLKRQRDAGWKCTNPASAIPSEESRAVIWFKHQPIPGWAGKTAYDLVGEGKSDKVLAYLEAVRSGVYA